MTNIFLIRTAVFNVTQTEMAKIAGVKQATISRWESSDPSKKTAPTQEHMANIRAEAKARNLNWCDAWFFEYPKGAA